MAERALDKLTGRIRTRGTRALACGSLCLLLSVPFLMTGCDFPGRPDPARRPVPADQVLEFAVLYRQNCAGCHGTDGKLGPAPPLNDALFRGIVPETELESIITQGRNKTLMPGFGRENGGTLTAAQIQVLVHEIKGIPYKIVAIPDGGMARVEVASGGGGISPKWGSPGEPPAGVPSYVQQTTDANDSAAGKKVVETSVFGRACAACHGDYGQGIARGDAVIQTINDPVFLSLCSDQVLRRYVITGRPDLGMPGFAEARPGSPHFQPLTDREVTGLVALLASWRETTAKGE